MRNRRGCGERAFLCLGEAEGNAGDVISAVGRQAHLYILCVSVRTRAHTAESFLLHRQIKAISAVDMLWPGRPLSEPCTPMSKAGGDRDDVQEGPLWARAHNPSNRSKPSCFRVLKEHTVFFFLTFIQFLKDRDRVFAGQGQ